MKSLRDGIVHQTACQFLNLRHSRILETDQFTRQCYEYDATENSRPTKSKFVWHDNLSSIFVSQESAAKVKYKCNSFSAAVDVCLDSWITARRNVNQSQLRLNIDGRCQSDPYRWVSPINWPQKFRPNRIWQISSDNGAVPTFLELFKSRNSR